jgi:hypothetical protein
VDTNTPEKMLHSQSIKEVTDSSWSTDTGVSAISNEIFQHLQQYQKKTAQDAGELEAMAPTY